MITLLGLVPLLIALICCFSYYRKRKKAYAILSIAAVPIVCCVIGLISYVYYSDDPLEYYTYEISVDSKRLESFFVDFDTPQQYEDWFCPDERRVTTDYLLRSTLKMRKTIVLEKTHSEVYVRITCYVDTPYAGECYNSVLAHSRDIPYRQRKDIGAEYEYAIGDAYTYKKYNGFWYEPDGEYNSTVAIRYKFTVFEFFENTDEPRENRLGEAIDQLWADYEQYKLDNNLT